MADSLYREPVAGVLADMYRQAEQQNPRDPGFMGRFRALPPTASALELADAAEDVYMPVDPDTGTLAYSLVRAARPETVVEFGMSYGISTVHLAAALQDNGTGHVYTTELSTKKIASARQTFAAAGLDDRITILEGDALQTLADVPGSIGVVLLDGWKDMYLPVLHALEPRLSPGALILADNTSRDQLAPYLEYVRDPAHGFTSVGFPARKDDNIELSCRL